MEFVRQCLIQRTEANLPPSHTILPDTATGRLGLGLGGAPHSYTKLHLLALLGLAYEDAPDKYSLVMKEVYQQVRYRGLDRGLYTG